MRPPDSSTPAVEEDLITRLRKRAYIRRNISTRKSVQEGKPDRLADLLDEAAAELERLKKLEADVEDRRLEERFYD